MPSSATARRHVALQLAFAITVVGVLPGVLSVSHADENWDREQRYREHEFREQEFHQHEFLDSRYHHDRYYPPAGFAFGVLPRGHMAVSYRGTSFFFGGGVWYSAAGPGRFVVVVPPVGLVVPVLPPVYATVWVAGVPYYYANNTYYVRTPEGYVVVNAPPPTVVVEHPPSGPVTPQPQASTVYQTPLAQLSIYPNHGQSLDQQATDRYACHRWASSQTGYDPSLPNGPGGTDEQKDGYVRAMRACLDARGYTVW